MIGGAAISWRSQKQTCVALSTAEAEYVALASATQEAVWLKQLVNDVLGETDAPTTIFPINNLPYQKSTVSWQDEVY